MGADRAIPPPLAHLAPARNAASRTLDWRFTTEDARIKLKHLYPAIEP